MPIISYILITPFIWILSAYVAWIFTDQETDGAVVFGFTVVLAFWATYFI